MSAKFCSLNGKLGPGFVCPRVAKDFITCRTPDDACQYQHDPIYTCCDEHCNRSAPLSECRMLKGVGGGIGPLCPDCGEVMEREE